VIFVPLAYVLYSAVTESGFVGWLHYAQQRLVGSYSPKLSYILAGGAVLLAAGLVLHLGSRFWPQYFAVGETRPDAGSSKASAAQAAPAGFPSARLALLVPTILVALVWLVGFGVYAWTAHQKAADARAHYDVIDLRAPGAHRPEGTHIALYGATAVPGLEVAHVINPGEPSEKVDYRLVPIVPRAWTQGDPVRFILKADDAREFGDLLPTGSSGQHGTSPPSEAGAILARIGGTVPAAAAAQFHKVGAPLAVRVYVLTRIPARDGKPLDASEDMSITVSYVLPCALLTAVIGLLALGVWVAGKLKAASARR
jgi:hypothetical protein